MDLETKRVLVYIHAPGKASSLDVKGGDDDVEAKWGLADGFSAEFVGMFANHQEIVLESLKAV
jgi:hypothetical protein